MGRGYCERDVFWNLKKPICRSHVSLAPDKAEYDYVFCVVDKTMSIWIRRLVDPRMNLGQLTVKQAEEFRKKGKLKIEEFFVAYQVHSSAFLELYTRLNRNMARYDLGQIEFLARIVDVNADQVALLVIVEHYSFRYLATFDARFHGEVDVEGVGVGIVVQFHGLNPRSGNAL